MSTIKRKRNGSSSGKTSTIEYNSNKPVDQVPMGELHGCLYLDRVAGISNVFSKAQCTGIINTALNTWVEQESMIQKKIEQTFEQELDYRNTTLFVPRENDEWLSNKILETIQSFNNGKQGYGFSIKGLLEPPCLMRYQASDINKHGKPGKYDWHLDIGPSTVTSIRKISYSILLNYGEYEGGEFITKISKNDDSFEKNNNPEVGIMILFPSFMLHRVTEVTKGTRYVLVGWVHGDSFR